MGDAGRSVWVLLLGALLVFGCGDDDDGTDDPDVDMGGEVDMSMDEDGGSELVVDCTAAPGDDFYTPPDGLPDHSAAERGRLVRCATLPTLTASELDARARRPINFPAERPDNYTGPTLTEDSNVTLVGYRSERRNGDGAYASGKLYLPPDASDAPLLIYVSGTTGMGDECAPSKRLFQDLERALPFLLGNGTPVFVPDLIGLGTPGTYAYFDAVEAAHSVLDGARAALAAAPDGALSGSILVAGHSAGGHAALATQSMHGSYAPELDVVGVAGVAPGWFDLTIFAQVFLTPDRTIDPTVNGNTGSFIAMSYVGIGAAYDGEDVAWNPIRASLREDAMAALNDQCIEEAEGPAMTEALFGVAATVGDLFDENFAASVRQCGFGVCSGPGELWYGRLGDQRPAFDSDGPELVMLAGDEDATIPIGDLDTVLENAGFGSGCCFRGAQHNSTATEAAPWLLGWVEAVAAGESTPACPGETIAQCVGGSDMDGGVSMDGGVPMDGGT